MRKAMVMALLFALALALWGMPSRTAWAEGTKKAEAPGEGILLVAFGTSEPQARGAIDGIVAEVKKAFPEREVRLAYTSNIIRRKILREEGLAIDSPLIALAKMQDEGITAVTVQSLHIIRGEEFHQIDSVVRALEGIRGKYAFDRLSLGEPLLSSMEDYENTLNVLKARWGKLVEDGDAVVFMGHGTHHPSNSAYSKLQALFDREGLPFVMGLVEAFPDLEMVKKRLAELRPKKVWLVPFMVVAGDHARNDMADEDDPESWISVLKGEGYSVEALLEGLGDGDGVAKLFIGHIREASEAE